VASFKKIVLFLIEVLLRHLQVGMRDEDCRSVFASVVHVLSGNDVIIQPISHLLMLVLTTCE
jgi:hypothetical protein